MHRQCHRDIAPVHLPQAPCLWVLSWPLTAAQRRHSQQKGLHCCCEGDAGYPAVLVLHHVVHQAPVAAAVSKIPGDAGVSLVAAHPALHSGRHVKAALYGNKVKRLVWKSLNGRCSGLLDEARELVPSPCWTVVGSPAVSADEQQLQGYLPKRPSIREAATVSQVHRDCLRVQFVCAAAALLVCHALHESGKAAVRQQMR